MTLPGFGGQPRVPHTDAVTTIMMTTTNTMTTMAIFASEMAQESVIDMT